MYAVSDTGEVMGKKGCDGRSYTILRLYKFIYNVAKIVWTKKIILFL
jgi:hypothetical protein